MEDLQVQAMNTLLDSVTLIKLQAAFLRFGPEKTLPVEELLSTLHSLIWRELADGRAMDSYRRNLQKAYFGNLQQALLYPKK